MGDSSPPFANDLASFSNLSAEAEGMLSELIEDRNRRIALRIIQSKTPFMNCGYYEGEQISLQGFELTEALFSVNLGHSMSIEDCAEQLR